MKMGPVRESNPGPRAPEARIIPLDQQAIAVKSITKGPKYGSENETMVFVEAWKLCYDATTNWYRYHSCQNLDENIDATTASFVVKIAFFVSRMNLLTREHRTRWPSG